MRCPGGRDLQALPKLRRRALTRRNGCNERQDPRAEPSPHQTGGKEREVVVRPRSERGRAVAPGPADPERRPPALAVLRRSDYWLPPGGGIEDGLLESIE